MSKNYELLSRLNETDDLSTVRGSQSVATKRHQPSFNGHERMEMGKLIRRVFLLPAFNPPHMVVFAAVDKDQGCARICAHAGEVLATHVAASVCVVDANLRAPSLHEEFGVCNKQGLTDVVQEQASLANVTEPLSDANLCVLTHGSDVSNTDELLNSSNMRARMQEIRTQFEYVLVNAPPIGLYPDPIILGHMADGIVLVVEADSTRREAVREAKEQIEAAGVRLFGIVLNNRRFPIPEPIYYWL